jgi:hypothetical protein
MIFNKSLEVANAVVSNMIKYEACYSSRANNELVIDPFRDGDIRGLSITNLTNDTRVNIGTQYKSSNIEICYGPSRRFGGNIGPNVSHTEVIRFPKEDVEKSAKFCLEFLNSSEGSLR